jgi:HEAT repeat protein
LLEDLKDMRNAITHRALLRVGVVLTIAMVAGGVAAQPAKPPPKAAPKAAPVKADVGAALQKLKSNDEAQIRAGLDELKHAASGASNAAPQVVDVLSKGLSEPLTHLAIDTLGELENPESSPILAQYATHRTLTLRRGAVKALTRTKGAAAAAALRRALGDADAMVRNSAAAGLGALKAKDAIGDLFIALDHKLNEAAASIGQLCNAEQCEQLAGKLGKLPFDVVTTGLDPVLFRPSSEVSDDTKIKVVGRLVELGTAESNRFLKDVEKRLTKETSARLRQSVEQGVKATTGGSQ